MSTFLDVFVLDEMLVLDIWHGNKGIDLAAWKARHALWAMTSDKPTMQEGE